ncbi:MAG: hypothetical protein M1829_002296 [Trizodia sp. TS-e1964]|nr:MAG: hypothetical protein M1829_002296 [Trizodia sp. TS-e1964]
MPLTPVFHDSLPYIDPPPSAHYLSAASALLAAELPPQTTTTLHPSLPPLPTPQISTPPTPLSSLDLTRYETTNTTPSTLHTHLTIRLANLALLGSYGRNAWLISNAQLEDILRALEAELELKGEEVKRVQAEREEAQRAVGGEIAALEVAWKRGVGENLSAMLAAEGVRREVLDRRRGGAR